MEYRGGLSRSPLFKKNQKKQHNMIKVTLGEKPKEKPFPKLMKLVTDGSLYYFVSAGIGVPLNDPQYPGVLERSDLFNWDMDLFKDYNESVTIQNA